MKLLVKPTTAACYLDSFSGCEIQPFRPSVVDSTQYVTQLLGDNRVALLSNKLVDESTDEEFAKYFAESDKDEDMAVQSFLSKFGSDSKLQKVEVNLTQKQAQAAEKQAAVDAEAAKKAAAAEAAHKEAQANLAAAAQKEADEKAQAAAKATAQKDNEAKKD